MLINRKAVKQLVKTYDKQVSKEFLVQLDKILTDKIINAIVNCKNFKRLTAVELLGMKGGKR